MEIVRRLNRHRLGASLAVSGVAIGVAALTIAGALAASFDASVDARARYYGSNVTVGPGAGQTDSLLPLTKIDEIRQVPGVAAAFPTYSFPANPGSSSESGFRMPDTIVASDPTEAAWSDLKTAYAQGHAIDADSSGEVVLGSAIDRELNKKIGDAVDLPVKPREAKADFVSHTFRVVGILDETGTAPDVYAYINITDGQMMLKDSLPAGTRDATDVTKVAGGIDVYARSRTPIGELDKIAERINKQVAGVKASKPSDLINSYRQSGSTYGALTWVVALLAFLIGGLWVAMVMFKVVAERAGAAERSRPWIMGEVLAESTLIGLLGGVIGWVIGALISTLANALPAPGQSRVFLVTPGLTILVIAFSTVVGLVGGVLPARRAAAAEPAVRSG